MSITNVKSLVDSLSKWSVRKIIVVALCVYPIAAGYFFKDELNYLLSSKESIVKPKNITEIVQITHNIYDKYNANSVAVFIYQPDSSKKTWKERITYQSDLDVMKNLEKIELISHAVLLSDLNRSNSVKIEEGSSYKLERMLDEYNLTTIYVIPIKNDYGLILAEAVVSFDRQINDQDLNKLIDSVEMIGYSMISD